MKFLFLFMISSLSYANFDWQGHRGARGLYPENTLGAMKEAMKYPITTLEMDVIISKDKKVVVSHEPWLNEEMCTGSSKKPVKDKNYNLYAMTYREIVAIDCGTKVHPRFTQQQKTAAHKPLLSDLVKVMEKEIKQSGRAINYNVEIKSTPEDEKDGYQPEYKVFTDLVMAEILSLLPSKRFTIQSFDWRVLKYMHEKYPDVRLVALRETPYTPQGVIDELGFVPAIFSPDYTMLKASEVEFFHQKGAIIVPWTVNNQEDMKKLMEIKVDGIITDYPNLIIAKCPEGYNEFENNCVKIPTHAIASATVPGWKCKEGHWQKRSKCEKIKMPTHSVLSEDGMSWLCKEGFKRYRDKCKKI